MYRKKFTVKKFFYHLILILWCSIVGIFLYWLITSSFKTNRTIFSRLWGLPQQFNLENYIKVFTKLNFTRYAINSLLVVGAAVIILLIVSCSKLDREKLQFHDVINYYRSDEAKEKAGKERPLVAKILKKELVKEDFIK